MKYLYGDTYDYAGDMIALLELGIQKRNVSQQWILYLSAALYDNSAY